MRRKHARIGDPRLAPFELLLVDDEAIVLRAHRKLAEEGRGLPPPGVRLATAANLDALETRHRGTRKKGNPGRLRLRGAYLDLYLVAASTLRSDEARAGAPTAFAVLEWMEDRYPRTPVVIYTSALVESVELMARLRGYRFIRNDAVPVGALEAHGYGEIEHLLLGFVEQPGRPITVVTRDALNDERARRFFERTMFAPWNLRCLRARKFLIIRAGYSAGQLDEHLLRTMDAYFEGVSQKRLWEARAVDEHTIEQDRWELRKIFGVSDLEELRMEFERETRGRGSNFPEGNFHALLADAKHPRPSARRGRP